MNKIKMKRLLASLIVITAANFSRAALFTNIVSADSFVRSNAPTSNYGAAGALSVSGATATNTSGTVNGIADTFIRFNTAATVTALNSLFGLNNWVISGATLRVVETGNPNNNIFTRGKGAFEIFWISNDSWTEGTGTPMAPTSDGIVFTNEPPLLTNTASLGIFTNTAANSTNLYSLSLPSAFTSDGGDISVYLTAIDPATGFTFNSQNFGSASQRPVLILSAVPPPGNIGITLSGTDVVISGTNGATGETCVVVSTANLHAPLNQWTPIATNVLGAAGNFSITATNAAGADAPAQQYFILQTH